VVILVHGWRGEKCEVMFEVDKRTSNGAQGERYGKRWVGRLWHDTCTQLPSKTRHAE
jgi:hypothetical protein